MFLTIGELKVKCMRFWPLLLTVITLLLSQLPVRAAPLSIGDKATLQAAMQLHIEKNLVAGAYLHLVFRSEVDNRAPLMRLMKLGKIKQVD